MRTSDNKIFAVWKPKGPSSAQFLDLIKKKLRIRKVGHAGTLDPLASGILIVGVGRAATSRLHMAVGAEKEYVVKIKLGATSSTDDEEGKKTKKDVKAFPHLQRVERCLKDFVGNIDQTPPVYSAIKINGTPAYKLARMGKKIELRSRKVKIYSIEILSYEWPHLALKVVTGPGVYIRSLARDIGAALGVGGYVTELTRTRVGEFTRDGVMVV